MQVCNFVFCHKSASQELLALVQFDCSPTAKYTKLANGLYKLQEAFASGLDINEAPRTAA
jgi:hypothetical protein